MNNVVITSQSHLSLFYISKWCMYNCGSIQSFAPLILTEVLHSTHYLSSCLSPPNMTADTAWTIAVYIQLVQNAACKSWSKARIKILILMPASAPAHTLLKHAFCRPFRMMLLPLQSPSCRQCPVAEQRKSDAVKDLILPMSILFTWVYLTSGLQSSLSFSRMWARCSRGSFNISPQKQIYNDNLLSHLVQHLVLKLDFCGLIETAWTVHCWSRHRACQRVGCGKNDLAQSAKKYMCYVAVELFCLQ